MPLPQDGTIHLTGYSRPGETSQSRPKQAMIIRMSDKTLDLLEAMPQLHFEFSDNPGLIVGDTFFPVTSVQETSPHDLYLRTSSAAKRNAPLKLYANITGKFAVERQLDDRITDKVRASAADAQNQRAGHTTIFVKTPTDLPLPNGKKKKDATMFRKPVRPTDQPRRPAPAASATSSSSGASPAPPQSQRSKEALQDIRSRMIRCIAAAERTSDQVVKLVGGNDSSAAMKRDILDLLDEIAEPVPLPSNSKAPKNYRLKTKSWLEVRPYGTPGLSETERTNMARSAKLALRALKIPESDPAWSHVQYRNSNVGQGSEPSERKRGLMSNSTKKVAKTKDAGDYTGLKAPGSRPSTSSSIRDDEPGRSLPSKPSASRRPGSGFKAKQPTPTESREFASGRSPVINGKAILGEPSSATSDSRRSQNPSSSQASDKRVPSQKVEELQRDDAAPSDSERSERMRERERALKAKEREREREDRERDKREREREDRERDKREREREREEREREKREREREERERDKREREREDRDRDKRDRGAEREREREKDRERERRDFERQRDRERTRRREAEFESDRERDRPRKKTRVREWSQEREEGERSDDGFRPLKRKKIPEDDNYEPSSRPGMKKRKIESPPPRSTKPRDLSLPKKPEVDLPPRPKTIKKESSPFPPLPKIPKESSPLPKIKKEPITQVAIPPAKTSSSSNQAPSNNKPKPKRRRPEDIYTSSEDEGEIRSPVKRESVSATIPITINNNYRSEVSSQPHSHSSKPPTHDYAALRAQYDSSYLPYLTNFQRLMKHKNKLRSLLKKMEKGSTGSVTESDGDGDLLDPEDLKKLALEYHNQHEDLENIQQIFSRRD